MTGTNGSKRTMAAGWRSKSVSPTSTTTYTATATGTGGTTTATVTITVNGVSAVRLARQRSRSAPIPQRSPREAPPFDRDCHECHSDHNHRNQWQQTYDAGSGGTVTVSPTSTTTYTATATGSGGTASASVTITVDVGNGFLGEYPTDGGERRQWRGNGDQQSGGDQLPANLHRQLPQRNSRRIDGDSRGPALPLQDGPARARVWERAA